MTEAVVGGARRTLAPVGIALIAVYVGGAIVQRPDQIRMVVAGLVGVCAIIGAIQWPRRAVIATLVLLPFLALARRLLLELTPWQSTDPLLLVAPAVAGVIIVRLFILERRELVPDRISQLVLVVAAISVLQVANPRGGGLGAGAAALLYTVAPLLWFFVGRELATRALLRVVFTASVASGCLIAVYGLRQTWNGLPSWDATWVAVTGYGALDVEGVIRAFGTFPSGAEYATFLAIGIVVAICFALKGRPYLLPAVPLLAVALFYESSRGIIVTTVATLVVVLAASTGNARRAVVMGSVCILAVGGSYLVSRDTLQARAQSSSDPLVSHQLGGLADPLNKDESTATTHVSMITNGFKSGITDPFGHGIASITLAGATINGANSSTEVDISNAFVGLGTLGGLAYLALVLLILRAALITAVERRDPVSLAILGILVLCVGQWWNGAYYAVSPLIWVAAGFLVADRRRA